MGTDKRERQKAGRQARIEAAREAQKKADQRGKLIRLATLIGVVVVAVAIAAFLQTRSSDDETVAADGDSTSTTATTAPSGAAPAAVPPPPAGRTITGPTPCPKPEGEERATKFEQAPPMCIDPAKTYQATFDTNKGVVKVTLDTETTPNTTNNFVVLSRYGYYDGTALFRVDDSIDIIQGGSPGTNTASDPGPGYTIKDEGGKFTYKEGQLVMARSQGPDSSGAQFFLTTGPEVSQLDSQGTYLNFGNVDEGLPVLQEIMGLGVPFPADSQMSGLGSGPKEPVIVNKITIAES